MRWTVGLLADEAGLSRSGFAARFAKLVGEPPLAYLTRLRMQRASEQLRSGAMNYSRHRSTRATPPRLRLVTRFVSGLALRRAHPLATGGALTRKNSPQVHLSGWFSITLRSSVVPSRRRKSRTSAARAALLGA